MPRILGLRIVHFVYFHCTHTEWKYHIKCVAKQSSLRSHTKTILSIWRQNWIYHVTLAARGLGDVRFREIKWMPSALPYVTDDTRRHCNKSFRVNFQRVVKLYMGREDIALSRNNLSNDNFNPSNDGINHTLPVLHQCLGRDEWTAFLRPGVVQ